MNIIRLLNNLLYDSLLFWLILLVIIYKWLLLIIYFRIIVILINYLSLFLICLHKLMLICLYKWLLVIYLKLIWFTLKIHLRLLNRIKLLRAISVKIYIVLGRLVQNYVSILFIILIMLNKFFCNFILFIIILHYYIINLI